MKESQQTEWKERWKDEYLRWVCGFANAEGGVLHIGRNDKGVVVGVPNAARLLEEIPNKVRDILGIVVAVNLREEGGKDWLEIVVEAYPSPISYKGEYHVRSGSTKQELKGAALDRFLLRKLGRHWDGVPVPRVSLADLDTQALAGFRKRAARSKRLSPDILAEADAALIDKLHLTEGNFLKRASVLLFHPDPERYVTGAFIKIGYFRSETDLLYHDEIHGDLFSQVARSMELLLTKYLKAAITYRGVQRVESLPVPEAALREAVLNAVIHRDYAVGAPIQIRVYDDRLKIWNPGHLPDNWTMDKFLEPHSSHPFNPDVASTFFRAGEIEAWGRGIQRIFEACREHGVPPPVIDYSPGDLWIDFPFSPGYLAVIPMVAGVSGHEEKTTHKTTQKTTQKTAQKILDLLTQHPSMSRRELSEQLSDITENGVKYHLNKLKATGRIRRVGADKGGHWEVIP